MMNGDVVGVKLGSTKWWRGFHGLRWFGCLGQGRGQGRRSVVGARFPSLISLPRSLLFISLQREKKKKKSSVLLICDFLVSGLRDNFLLVGKQSLLSSTVELKLYSILKLVFSFSSIYQVKTLFFFFYKKMKEKKSTKTHLPTSYI
jgi:hypothetical protein